MSLFARRERAVARPKVRLDWAQFRDLVQTVDAVPLPIAVPDQAAAAFREAFAAIGIDLHDEASLYCVLSTTVLAGSLLKDVPETVISQMLIALAPMLPMAARW